MSGRQKKISLDELVSLQSEKIFTNKDPNLPYIGLEHMAQGEPRLLGTSKSSASISVNAVFKKDDILFGKLRPNLRKSIRATFDGYCSTDILVLRSRDGVVPAFSEQVFQWDRIFSHAIATAAGTKMPRTSWNDLKRCLIFKPDTELEQSRISYILNTVDETIIQIDAMVAKLKQVRAGMLHDLLSYGLDEHGELRDPIAHPEQFKDSLLGLLPREWDVCTLGSLGRWSGGKTPSKANPEFWTPAMTLWITPKDVKNTEIGNSEDKLSLIGTSFMEVFPAGSLIVVGRSGILRHTLPVSIPMVPFTVNQDLKVLVPNHADDESIAKFLLFVFSSQEKEILHRCVKVGTTVESIDWKDFKNLFIGWPSERERNRIIDHIEIFNRNLSVYSSQMEKLIYLKSGLQDALFTGRIRVPESIMEGATTT